MLDRATRKKELIAIGAMHRAELVVGREAMRAASQPRTLGRSVLRHVADTVLGVAGRKTGLDLSGLDLASILPLLPVLRGRGGLLKLLLRSGALTGLAAGAIAFLRSRQRKPAPPSEHL